jgi:hypothetical protein
MSFLPTRPDFLQACPGFTEQCLPAQANAAGTLLHHAGIPSQNVDM